MTRPRTLATTPWWQFLCLVLYNPYITTEILALSLSLSLSLSLTLSTGAIEYTDCISAEG